MFSTNLRFALDVLHVALWRLSLRLRPVRRAVVRRLDGGVRC